jgi:ribosomal protein S18 acetylase RimI-like enzyme
MGTDTWIAEGGKGRIDAYAEITHRPTTGLATELDGDFWVRPGVPAADVLMEAMLQCILVRASALSVTASASAATAHLAVFCARANRGKRAFLERHGFVAMRRYLRMAIMLPANFTAPPPPAGVRIGDFDPAAHADSVRRLMTAAFSDDFRRRAEPLVDWRARLIERSDFDPLLWSLAWETLGSATGATGPGRERLCGAAIAYDYGEIGWIQGLAVRADRRGRGIGLALLRESFSRFAARGQKDVQLGVDAGNETGALRLYERAGMSRQQQVDLYVRGIDTASAPAQ